MMVEGPYLEVQAKEADDLEILGLEKLDQPAQDDVVQALHRMERATKKSIAGRFSVHGTVRQHVGLGTKTSLILSMLQAANQLAESDLAATTLQQLSARGGASGVGVNGFFCGGFILDAGHRQPDVMSLAPSSRRNPNRVPVVISRLEIPDRWRFRLLLPKGRRISGAEERGFFERHIPIPSHEVLETISILSHGLAAATAADDLEGLALALVALHCCGFKRRELEAQEPIVREVLAAAQELGAAGLSSLGPLVYLIHDKDEPAGPIDALADSAGIEDLGTWKGRAKGFELSSR